MLRDKHTYKLKIDEDFKRLIPPLSADEFNQLESNIRKDGCRDALVTWNNIIVDGHNRYEICTKHKIPFAMDTRKFGNKEEAVSWICANQLGRRNISEETRRYLIGKRYEMEKTIGGRNQFIEQDARPQNGTKHNPDKYLMRTRERLGAEYHIGYNTVTRYADYANALDVIVGVVPEFHKKVMSGEIKVTQDRIIRIAALSAHEIKRIGAELLANPNAYFGYTDDNGDLVKNTPIEIQLANMQIGAIKEMPKFDPDAEVLSLALTIPPWASSINRVLVSPNIGNITADARNKTAETLDELKAAIDKLLGALKEEK